MFLLNALVFSVPIPRNLLDLQMIRNKSLSMQGSTWSLAITILFIVLALILACASSLSLGSVSLSVADISRGLVGLGDPRIVIVMQEIRLPRVLLGIVIGTALGTSGAALQGLLRNPLAEPGLLGTAASAALGAVVALYHGWVVDCPLALPLAAMGSSAGGTLLLLAVAGNEASGLTLILSGVAVSSLALALTSLAMNLAPDPFVLSEMVIWLMGSLTDCSLSDVALVTPFVIAGLILLHSSGRGLDALILGEDTAASLGISLLRLRYCVTLGVAFSVGSAVSVTGIVGFVGLIVPHLLRPLVRYRPSALLFPSALGGSLLVTVADIVVRLIPTNSGEIMLGVMTSLVGAPFFFFLVFKLRHGTL